MHWTDIDRFIRSLRHYRLTKQQIKTLRGQALNGDLAGAQKGLMKEVAKHASN